MFNLLSLLTMATGNRCYQSSQQPPSDEKEKKDKDQPPDLDELFSHLLGKRQKNNHDGDDKKPDFDGINFFNFKAHHVIILLIVALLLWLLSGLYTVQERENGVELILGKHTATTSSGLNWNFPYPIGKVEKVDVQSIYTMRIGEFRTQKSNVSSLSQRDGQMLTSDENIVEIGAAVQYRIGDAGGYLFVANDPLKVLEDIVISAIREVVGASTVDEVLRDRRNEWPQQAKNIIIDTLKDFGIGFEIVAFELQDARAPAEVQDAFEDAVRAREDEERLRLQAEAYALERLPVARGEAVLQVQRAQAYQAQVLAKANSDVNRFEKMLQAYTLDKEVMRHRLYLEAMSSIYGSGRTILLDAPGVSPILNVGDSLANVAKQAAIHEKQSTPLAPATQAGGDNKHYFEQKASNSSDLRQRTRR